MPDRWGASWCAAKSATISCRNCIPRPGEPVIDKPGKGAFYATDLELILRDRGIKTLIVCGVTTEVCVNTSVREANDRGYECVVLSDCVGSYFPEFQKAALAMIKAQGGIFGWVSDSRRALAALGCMRAAERRVSVGADSVGARVPPRARAQVHSVFLRACNIETQAGELVTLVAPGSGNLPHGIRCAAPFARLRQGQAANLEGATLRFPAAEIVVDFSRAAVWNGRVAAVSPGQRGTEVQRVLRSRAPDQGIAPALQRALPAAPGADAADAGARDSNTATPAQSFRH